MTTLSTTFLSAHGGVRLEGVGGGRGRAELAVSSLTQIHPHTTTTTLAKAKAASPFLLPFFMPPPPCFPFLTHAHRQLPISSQRANWLQALPLPPLLKEEGQPSSAATVVTLGRACCKAAPPCWASAEPPCLARLPAARWEAAGGGLRRGGGEEEELECRPISFDHGRGGLPCAHSTRGRHAFVAGRRFFLPLPCPGSKSEVGGVRLAPSPQGSCRLSDCRLPTIAMYRA